MNMALDHSLTYKTKSLKNFLHRRRLYRILDILDSQDFKSAYSYLDIGCSNGYLTKLIAQRYKFSASKGVDHNNENLSSAQNQYDDIKFEFIDLNLPNVETVEKYNVVTCFETLEHVGNIENAIQQILSFAKNDSSFVLLSVPIEIGFWGIAKFIAKTLFGYSLKELKSGTTYSSYLIYLLTYKNISKFRDKRNGWGTHYGFDYREVDKILAKNNCSFDTQYFLSTKFYLIQKTI